MLLKEYRGLFLENVKVWLLFPSYRDTNKNKTLSQNRLHHLGVSCVAKPAITIDTSISVRGIPTRLPFCVSSYYLRKGQLSTYSWFYQL